MNKYSLKINTISLYDTNGKLIERFNRIDYIIKEDCKNIIIRDIIISNKEMSDNRILLGLKHEDNILIELDLSLYLIEYDSSIDFTVIGYDSIDININNLLQGRYPNNKQITDINPNWEIHSILRFAEDQKCNVIDWYKSKYFTMYEKLAICKIMYDYRKESPELNYVPIIEDMITIKASDLFLDSDNVTILEDGPKELTFYNDFSIGYTSSNTMNKPLAMVLYYIDDDSKIYRSTIVPFHHNQYMNKNDDYIVNLEDIITRELKYNEEVISWV